MDSEFFDWHPFTLSARNTLLLWHNRLLVVGVLDRNASYKPPSVGHMELLHSVMEFKCYQLVYFLTDRHQSLAPIYTISTQHTSPPVQSVAGRWISGLQRFIHSPKCWAHGTGAVGAITS